MAATSVYVSKESPSDFLPFWEASSRLESGSDPGFFQITASVLGLRSYEILHVSFKNRVSVSYSHSSLPYAITGGLPSQMSGLYLPEARPLVYGP